MRGKKKLESKKSLRFIVVIASVFLLFIGSVDELFAKSQREPISGTPMLRHQKSKVLREYGTLSRINADKDQVGRIVGENEAGLTKSFYAFNFGTNLYYSTSATCRSSIALSSGYYLHIYVEDDEFTRDQSRFSSSILDGISNEYKNVILPTETLYFGAPPTGDFTILLLDIKDSGGDTYVSGYFDSRNEFTTTSSNQRHMIYMDSKDGTPGSTTFYGTLAHEFQHFIHFGKDPLEETWVDEGLAGLARFVCGYGHRESHVIAFAQNPTTSLVVWADELANYGATYLFMLYLAEHYGGSTITTDIVANTGTGIAGINSALSQSGYGVTVNDIFKNWVIANYLNNLSISGGIYGYSDSFTGILVAPGNIEITNSHSTYPISGNGSVDRYAANYIKFTDLGGTYSIFILVPYSLSEGNVQSYSYTGQLGSFMLSFNSISGTLGILGIQQGSSNPTPAVVTNLSESNTISTGEVSGSGGCFIAIASYGSPLAQEVFILREFRDRYLLANAAGRALLSLYNISSPPLARFISHHERFKVLMRIALYPAVGLSYAMMNHPQETGLLSLGLILLFGLLLVRRRRG